ncbi:MAG: hypothetical protein NZ926_00915 [Candidatus Methanomethylicia archaeon]|nr:hypothetical protein [Candidatus Methanomethylicia archaeon]MDW7988724.1 hypothetical protein [Nitrososphaerota archaeon]
MVKKFSFFIITILITLLISIILTPTIQGVQYYSLAPPYREFQYFHYTRGTGSFWYMYDLNRGVLKGVCSATKNIGSLLDEADLTLILKGYIISPFSGVINRLIIRYTLKGLLYVKSICLPNTFSAFAKVGVYIDIMNLRINLASKELNLYYSGEDQYFFNDISKTVYQNLNLKVSRGESVHFAVIFHIKSVSTGALEDYSYSFADFSSSDYGLRIGLYIEYIEESRILASINSQKAYAGDTIMISGYLLSSRDRPISNVPLSLYVDSIAFASTYTDNSGYFSFKFLVPVNIQPSIKVFKVVFDGNDNYLPSFKDFNVVIPSFSLSASHYGIRISKNSIRWIEIYVNSIYGYDLSVEIDIKNVPEWLEYGIVDYKPSIPPFQFHAYFIAREIGECTITILAVGSDGQSKIIMLNIECYDDSTFSITVSPNLNEVFKNSYAYYNVTLTSINGYAGNINLFLEGSGFNFTSTFSLNPVYLQSIERSVKLAIYVSSSINEGIYDFIVKGVDDNGLTIYSNPFKLYVKKRPYFKVSIYPTSSSIFVNETATFYVTLISYNNFVGSINLEVSCYDNSLNYFKYNFSENPVHLLIPNTTKIVKLHLSSTSNIRGTFNFTLLAHSNEFFETCDFSIEIKFLALVKSYYVNWHNNSWHLENTFLPYEAIGLLINYEPLKKVSVYLPKTIFSEFHKQLVNFTTSSDGSYRLVLTLNGLNCTFGTHEILVLDEYGNVIGKCNIRVDSLKVYYHVLNEYSSNKISFHLVWNYSNESIKFRGGTLELVLNSSLGLWRGCFVNDIGIAIFEVPNIDFNDNLIFFIHYSNSPFKIKSIDSNPLIICIKYRRILYEILNISSKDFKFNFYIRFYYSDNEPAILKLMLLAYYNNEIKIFNYTTNNDGTILINFNTSFFKNAIFKLLCSDISNKWVSRIDRYYNLYWHENVYVLSYVHVNNKYVNFTFIPTTRFMDFHCYLHVMFYDESDSLFFSSSVPIFLEHGSIKCYLFTRFERRIHRIVFTISVEGYRVFEGLWVNGEYIWKLL